MEGFNSGLQNLQFSGGNCGKITALVSYLRSLIFLMKRLPIMVALIFGDYPLHKVQGIIKLEMAGLPPVQLLRRAGASGSNGSSDSARSRPQNFGDGWQR